MIRDLPPPSIRPPPTRASARATLQAPRSRSHRSAAWRGAIALAAGLALAGLGSARAQEPGAGAGATVTLTFLATCDIHGHVEPEKLELPLPGGGRQEVLRGGLALFGGYVANARRAHPGRVVVVDAGDMLQGTMVSNLGEGQAVVRAMNAIGYAAAAVGNHEFDFGPVGPHVIARGPGEDPRGALKARAAEAKSPWLTANITGEAGGPWAPSVRPFTVLTVDGIRVGIVGGTSEDTPHTTRAENVRGLRVGPLAPAIAGAAAEARKAGATVVVAVVHEGGECHRFDRPEDLSSCKPGSAIFRLARALPPGTVDAIFAGHTHQGVAAIVAGVPVLQAWSEARAFSRVDLTIDRGSGRVVQGGALVHPPVEVCSATFGEATGGCDPRHARGRAPVAARYEGREVTLDKAVLAAIAPDVERVSKLREELVGVTLDLPLTRRYRDESALGDLAADALRNAGHADVGITNGGGLRADLPAGPLRLGALFQAFPFDNRLAVAKVKGAALRRLLASNLGGDRGILSISGIRVTTRCEGRHLAATVETADGKPLADDAIYTVATSDFLVRGGDDFGLLGPVAPANLRIDEEGPFMRDLIASELRRRGPHIAGDRQLFDPARPRVSLPRPRPFPCTRGLTPPAGHTD